MANLLRSELYKLYKDSTFRMMTLTLAIVAIMLSIIIHYWGSPQEVFSGMMGFNYGLQMNAFVLKIALALLGGFFLSHEYSLGVMKITAASGYSRRQIYAAKTIAYMTGMVGLSLLIPVLCTAMGTIFNGFGTLQEAHALGYFFRTTGLTMLYAAAFASIVAAFAIATAVSGVTIGAVLLFMLFFDNISQGLGMKWAVYQYLYDHSVFKLFMGIAALHPSLEDMALFILVPVATIALFLGLGMASFSRMEIR